MQRDPSFCKHCSQDQSWDLSPKHPSELLLRVKLTFVLILLEIIRTLTNKNVLFTETKQLAVPRPTTREIKQKVFRLKPLRS